MNCLHNNCNTLAAMVARAKPTSASVASGTVGALPPSGMVGFAGPASCADAPFYQGDMAAVMASAQGMCADQTGDAYNQCIDAQAATFFADSMAGPCAAWAASKSKTTTTTTTTTGGGGGSIAVATCPPGQVKINGKCVDDPALASSTGVSPWWFVAGAAAVGVAIGGVYAVKRKGQR